MNESADCPAAQSAGLDLCAQSTTALTKLIETAVLGFASLFYTQKSILHEKRSNRLLTASHCSRHPDTRPVLDGAAMVRLHRIAEMSLAPASLLHIPAHHPPDHEIIAPNPKSIHMQLGTPYNFSGLCGDKPARNPASVTLRILAVISHSSWHCQRCLLRHHSRCHEPTPPITPPTKGYDSE